MKAIVCTKYGPPDVLLPLSLRITILIFAIVLVATSSFGLLK